MRVLVLLAASLVAAWPIHAAEPATPELPLFNGRDLTGWVVKCKPADAAQTWWRVEAGAIVADSLAACRT